jgi:hypothetical protein
MAAELTKALDNWRLWGGSGETALTFPPAGKIHLQKTAAGVQMGSPVTGHWQGNAQSSGGY